MTDGPTANLVSYAKFKTKTTCKELVLLKARGNNKWE